MYELSQEAVAVREAVEAFFNGKILPNHHLLLEQAETSGSAMINSATVAIREGADALEPFLAGRSNAE